MGACMWYTDTHRETRTYKTKKKHYLKKSAAEAGVQCADTVHIRSILK